VKGSTVSRRFSELAGVALFAAALIWVVALATYEPSDPAWFFSTGLHSAPANFAGRVGAFLAELSFQLVGYASYFVPAVLVIVGWNYFWCRKPDAAATKVAGAALLVTCISAFLSLVFATLQVSGKPFRAGGYLGEFIAKEMSDYLARTGSMIVILALIFFAIIMSTQFSFGRFFGSLLKSLKASTVDGIESFHAWREERRRERERREVIAKHTKKGAAPPEVKRPAPAIAAPATAEVEAAERRGKAARAGAPPAKDAAEAPAAAGFAGWKSAAKPPRVTLPPPLPLADPEPISKAPAERRKGDYALPPLALLDAAKAERKIDSAS
jgi:S-DNA-T family DNA segregation ATPase FtsK/SpoIIIE